MNFDVSILTQMPLPKISIITPSFNQGEYLEETIVSVLEQNYSNLEYIIIDGGSTDRSIEIIKKYQKYLAYWVSEKDAGQSQAINKGFRKASGDIISWLCSDDLYLPGALNKVATIFNQHPDVGLIHGKTILFNDKGKAKTKGAEENDLQLKYFAIIPFPQPSSFFRKSILEKVGMLDESLHYGMDYELLIRIALESQILKVDDVFSKYRLHEESKTIKKKSEFALEWLKIFVRFLLSLENDYGVISQFKNAGIFIDDGKRYKINRLFSELEVRLMACYCLYYQLVIYNDLLHKKHCFEILDTIKKIDPKFYRRNKLSSIENRIRFIPSPFLSILRRIMR